MASLILFVALFGSYSSQPNHCGWAIIEDEFQPLNFCQQEKNSDGSISSYIISCTRNNDAIEEKWWLHSETCSTEIESFPIPYLMSTKFNCNDTRCAAASYVTYKKYLSDECLSSSHVITDNVQPADAPNNDEIAPFRETTLITNTCYNDTNTPYHSLITCNNNSYSIHSYLDASCQRLFSTKVVESTDCNEITHCSETTSVDVPSTTSSYFTTSAEEGCNFINNMGHNVPSDKCMRLSSLESQEYKCNKEGDIEWFYYNNFNCAGNALYSYVFPRLGIIDMNCYGDTCSDTEYMELIIYKAQDECGVDAISDTDYDSHVYVVDSCMKTPDGGGVLYQCRNNKDDAQNAGYDITHYLDSECLIAANKTSVHSEIECLAPLQRRQHMVFCNGINEITIEQNDSYIIDCNYFINHHEDALGRIGEPLDRCMNMQRGQNMFSKKYQCNATRNGIEEIVYRDINCRDDNMYFVEARPDLNMFYCDSPNDCDSIRNYVTTNGVISNYDAVLIGKQYTNDSCAHSEDMERFWNDQLIIVDECWPIESDLYAVISCDSNGFVYHSLYTDDECSADSLVSDNHRFESEIDCIYGKLFETTHCPHWTTTTQIVTTAQIVNTTEMESTAKEISTTSEAETTEEEEEETKTTQEEEATTRSSDVFIPRTSSEMFPDDTWQNGEGEKEHEPNKEGECVNVFGGGDRAGIDCNAWAAIIFVLIFVAAALILFFTVWFLCSRDTKSCRNGICGNQSQLHVANGNDDDDLNDIVVQQLYKGQHVKPAVVKKEESGADADDDDDDLAISI